MAITKTNAQFAEIDKRLERLENRMIQERERSLSITRHINENLEELRRRLFELNRRLNPDPNLTPTPVQLP